MGNSTSNVFPQNQKVFHSYESSQALSPNNHKPGEVGGNKEGTAKRSTAKCLSEKLPATLELDASVPIFQESACVGVFLSRIF